MSVFALNHDDLLRLGPLEAVLAFRDLLFATARSRAHPVNNISISCDANRADGGVDASILGEPLDHPVQGLLAPGTRFQIKAGKSAAPWQESWVREELFGAHAPDISNLGTGVRRCLEERGRYMLVCFGIDPVDERLRLAQDNFVNAFAQVGFPDISVEILAQTQLLGLFGEFPGICLRLSGRDGPAFQCHETWAHSEQMRPQLRIGPEQQQLIDDIRDRLRSGPVRHVRLIGEAGIGKTRLALEALRTDDLAPLVVYVSDGATFQRGTFFNDLIRPDNQDTAVLVIDECQNKDRASIWNLLGARTERIHLITIDHGPDDSVADDTLVIRVPPMGEARLQEILSDYGVGESDARRWAAFCEGCPRVAHLVGANLRSNPNDVFRNPSTVEIWDRFVIGHDDANSETVELRKIVLRNLALFERFGFEPPVADEAQLVSRMAEKCDPRLTWARLQSLVKELKERRVLQGVTTLYITPRLLHLHLFREFWDHHGRGLDLGEFLRALPPQLWHWFVGMLRYAHTTPVAEAAVDHLLSHDGWFPTDAFPDSPQNGRLILALAETNPRPTLRCLDRTIGNMNESGLEGILQARQSIVWALELIAVWEDCFCEAAELLLRLAEAEKSRNTNNATGTFHGLFSLMPEFAATQASPRRRLTVLRNALDAGPSKRRRIALGACRTALSRQSVTRFVGPEHQGLRPTIDFWTPATWGELWSEYEAVWDLLVQKLADWTGEDRELLIETLVDSAQSTLDIPRLTSKVLNTLEMIADDPAANVLSLVRFIRHQVVYRASKFAPETVTRLRSISARLDGHDFPSRLRRFVKFASSEDSRAVDPNQLNPLGKMLEELSAEAAASPVLLERELVWLVCEESATAFHFAYLVGRLDAGLTLLSMILSYQEQQGDQARSMFLSGYLAALYESDIDEWQRAVGELCSRQFLRWHIADIAINTGLTNVVVRRVIQLCRDGEIDPARLERWWFSGRLHQLSELLMMELLDYQMTDEANLWHNALQMSDTYFLRDRRRQLPEELIFRILTHRALADHRYGDSLSYYWARLAAAFVAEFPHRKWKFFETILVTASRHWSVLSDLDTTEEKVLTRILTNDPGRAWEAIAEAWIRTDDGCRSGLQMWLSDGGHRSLGDEGPGLLQHIPTEKLFDWIDEDIEERGYWVAGALAKSLDSTPAGLQTQAFIAKYVSHPTIRQGILGRFHRRGYVGPESVYYRGLRDEARAWLAGVENPTVVGWIQEYIESLNRDIQRADIAEERRL